MALCLAHGWQSESAILYRIAECLCQNVRNQYHFEYMDELDHSLISLLRANARMNIADLAHKLGVSRGTVTNRLRKLEDTQVIVGYTVRLKPEAET